MTELEYVNDYQQIKKANKYLHNDLLNTWGEYSYVSSFIVKHIHKIFSDVFESDVVVGDLNIDIDGTKIYITTSYPINIDLLDRLRDFLGVDAKIDTVGSKRTARIRLTFPSDI
ncbi:hypothetical protein [uncultured Methanobrevibacter sp.]|uniref:hypothetical protein n=1 Tax=uncultured Methanobrevibacter sp. TaxID=253161 RepID=UPI0025E1BAF1|nr:hypothetical protein [uncultured Methanobrevibacter sp.]